MRVVSMVNEAIRNCQRGYSKMPMRLLEIANETTRIL